jgi:hypothetical protein
MPNEIVRPGVDQGMLSLGLQSNDGDGEGVLPQRQRLDDPPEGEHDEPAAANSATATTSASAMTRRITLSIARNARSLSRLAGGGQYIPSMITARAPIG